MPRKGFRVQDAPEFSAGRRREVPIQARNVVSYHLLRVLYDTSVAGGTGAGTVLGAYRIARELTVQAGGRPLHHFRPHTMERIVQAWFPEEYAQTDPADLSAGGGDTGREALIPIPYFMPWSFTPDEAALPTRRADARLLTDWGIGDELVDGEDGTLTLSNVTTELLEAPLYGIRLPDGGEAPASFFAGVSIRHRVAAVSQDGTISVQLKHLENGQELRAVLVEGMAKDDANNDEYLHDDRVVVNVGPLDIDGDEEFEEVAAEVVQNRNKVEYQRGAVLTGTYILDSAEDRRTTEGELWRVRGEEKPTLDIQVAKQTNDTQVVVTTLAITRGQRRRILSRFNGGRGR